MRIRLATLSLMTLMVLTSLQAQMMGSGNGRTPGMGSRDGSSMMPTGGMLGLSAMQLPVASDGTVFVVRKSATTANASELVAIASTGTERWHFPLQGRGMTGATLVGNLVVLSSMDTTGTFPTLTFTSKLIGVNVASGTQAWTLDLAGAVPMGITAYSDGFYVVTTGMLAGGMMQGSLTRKLMAVGTDGKVKWTVNLD